MAKFSDIVMAYDFVSTGDPYDHYAYISRSTGDTFWRSDSAGESDVPDDVHENPDYVEIPHAYDLDLGKELVWRFVDHEIPALGNKVRDIFSRRGAWGRYKSFLDNLGMLDAWYKFEDSETNKALRDWCEAKGISLEQE